MPRSDASTFDRIAAPYNRGMAPLERLWLRQMRSSLMPRASGSVLEVGVGTGANLQYYPQSILLTGIDESSGMLAVAAHRADALGQSIRLCQMDAEHLALPDGRFDTVVSSLVLCSVMDQRRALGELSRVLRNPGGRLLLIEHMRPTFPLFAWLVDLANIPWHAFNGRCHLNRETERALVRAGFQVEREETRVGGLFRLIVARPI